MMENISARLHAYVKQFPDMAVNFRKIFESELFGLAMKQVSSSTKQIYLSLSLSIWSVWDCAESDIGFSGLRKRLPNHIC